MSDPQNPIITGYHEPTGAETRARKSRNIAIALGLIAFVTIIFLVMVYKIKTLQV